MGLHLGFHWVIIIGIVKKHMKRDMTAWKWTFRVATAVAVYDDYAEPLILFVLDYISVMDLFVFAGHYIAAGFRWGRKTQKGKRAENSV